MAEADEGAHTWLLARFYPHYPKPDWYGSLDAMPVRMYEAWSLLDQAYAENMREWEKQRAEG